MASTQADVDATGWVLISLFVAGLLLASTLLARGELPLASPRPVIYVVHRTCAGVANMLVCGYACEYRDSRCVPGLPRPARAESIWPGRRAGYLGLDHPGLGTGPATSPRIPCFRTGPSHRAPDLWYAARTEPTRATHTVAPGRAIRRWGDLSSIPPATARLRARNNVAISSTYEIPARTTEPVGMTLNKINGLEIQCLGSIICHCSPCRTM